MASSSSSPTPIAARTREPTGVERPFLLPQFSPRLVRFTLDPATGKFDLKQQIILRRYRRPPLTGLPNIAVSADPSPPYNDEVPIDLFGNVLALDPLGGDLEGVVVDEDGSFWLCDEYRPAIYHFTPEGKLIERYIPIGTHAAAGLPCPRRCCRRARHRSVARRAGAAPAEPRHGSHRVRDGKIYAFVQSPSRNPATLANGALNAMKNVRLVEFDPATLATRQFLYIMDNPAAACRRYARRQDRRHGGDARRRVPGRRAGR